MAKGLLRGGLEAKGLEPPLLVDDGVYIVGGGAMTVVDLRFFLRRRMSRRGMVSWMLEGWLNLCGREESPMKGMMATMSVEECGEVSE